MKIQLEYTWITAVNRPVMPLFVSMIQRLVTIVYLQNNCFQQASKAVQTLDGTAWRGAAINLTIPAY